MSTNGDVNITILDGGGTVVVPLSTVVLLLGFSVGGTVGQIYASQNPNTIQSNLTAGPLCEAAALLASQGATVLAVPTGMTTMGTAKSVQFTGTGTSVITTALDGTYGAYDDYFVVFKVITGGTRGTAGITFQISLDGGRNFGPTLALGTATTYAISGTGITLDFSTGTLVAGDVAQFQTIAPIWDTGQVQAALQVVQASAYAIAGWGSALLIGDCTGANASTIEGYLDTLQTQFIYTRLQVNARDAHAPTTWGGAGETESTWMSAIETDFSAVSARRILATGGHYNTPSQFRNSAAGSPVYRRPLSWSQACRQAVIPPQRHSGRVRDGALSTIVVDPTNDPKDGFIYHNESVNPGLDAARFCSARTRIGKGLGYYIVNPNLMSSPGSVFTILPLGNVIDVACDIVHQVGQDEINEDVRTNANGTIYENDARTIETEIYSAIRDNMISTAEISAASVVVDRSANVQSTSKVPITVTIQSRGYVLEEDVTIGFGSVAA